MADCVWMSATHARHLLVTAAVAMGVVGAVGSIRSGDLDGYGDSWALALVSVGYALLGWFVIGRRPDLRVGWSMLVGGAVSALAFLSSWWSYKAFLDEPGSLPFGSAAAWLALWVSPLVWPLVLVVPLVLFPAGVSRSHRWTRFLRVALVLVAALVGVAAVLAVPVAFHAPVELLDASGVNSGPVAEVAIWAQAIARMIGFAATLVALVGLVVAARGAHGDVRRSYRIVGAGVAWVVATIAVGVLIPAFAGQRHKVPEAVFELALLAIPGSIAFAMVRHELYDVRAAISRSVLWVLTGIPLVAVYAIVLTVLAGILGESRAVTISSVLAAGAVVLVSAPIIAVARRLTRRWLGRGGAMATVAARYGEAISAEPDAPGSLRNLARTVQDELRLGSVKLDIDHLQRVTVGTPSGPESQVVLSQGPRRIGELTVTPRRGEQLSAPDLRNLAEIGAYVAVAADAIRTSDDLGRARTALENAHADERRRVRRDLHDGVGPTLASVRLKLAARRRSHPADDDDGIIEQVSDAIREIRRIVEGLQPSVLEDLGLVPALHILLADTRQTSGLDVALRVPTELPDLEPQTAATAYRVVAEGLANVIRHSRATAATVQLEPDNTHVSIEVSDNGCGFDPACATGMGLRSIAARADAAGGDVTIRSVPGAGTTITVRLPT